MTYDDELFDIGLRLLDRQLVERQERLCAGDVSERQLRCERDRRRGGLKRFVGSIEIQENASEDPVRKRVVRLLPQCFSKRLFGIREAAEVAEGEGPGERVVSEVAAHLPPRYSRTAS